MPEENTIEASDKPSIPGSREMMRVCSDKEDNTRPTPSIKHNERVRCYATPSETQTPTPFHAERLFLQGPYGEDWFVHEIVVDGVSQVIEQFSTKDVPIYGLALDIAPCNRSLEFVVTYTGQRPEGAHFYGAVIGRGPAMTEPVEQESRRVTRTFAEGLRWLNRYRELADFPLPPPVGISLPLPPGISLLVGDDVYALAYAQAYHAAQEALLARFVGCEDLSPDEIWRRLNEAVAWANEGVDRPAVRPATMESRTAS
jgi:hypothetical protein